MAWTSDKPTAPGWYWYRGPLSGDGVVVAVVARRGGEPTGPLEAGFAAHPVPFGVAEVAGEWWGPLEAPA